MLDVERKFLLIFCVIPAKKRQTFTGSLERYRKLPARNHLGFSIIRFALLKKKILGGRWGGKEERFSPPLSFQDEENFCSSGSDGKRIGKWEEREKEEGVGRGCLPSSSSSSSSSSFSPSFRKVKHVFRAHWFHQVIASCVGERKEGITEARREREKERMTGFFFFLQSFPSSPDEKFLPPKSTKKSPGKVLLGLGNSFE